MNLCLPVPDVYLTIPQGRVHRVRHATLGTRQRRSNGNNLHGETELLIDGVRRPPDVQEAQSRRCLCLSVPFVVEPIVDEAEQSVGYRSVTAICGPSKSHNENLALSEKGLWYSQQFDERKEFGPEESDRKVKASNGDS